MGGDGWGGGGLAEMVPDGEYQGRGRFWNGTYLVISV